MFYLFFIICYIFCKFYNFKYFSTHIFYNFYTTFYVLLLFSNIFLYYILFIFYTIFRIYIFCNFLYLLNCILFYFIFYIIASIFLTFLHNFHIFCNLYIFTSFSYIL